MVGSWSKEMEEGLAQSSEPQDEDLWGILPDELLERVFALLPVTNLFRAGAVCKKWNTIIASTSFLHLCEEVTSTRPWYFMWKDQDTSGGLAYDPVAEKWHNLELPRIDTPNRFVATVNGLLCFIDNLHGYDLYICNPMTKATRKLTKPSLKSKSTRKLRKPSLKSKSRYCTVSMIVNKATKVQTTVVARCEPMPDGWTLSMEIYDSSSKKWRTTAQTLLLGWRGCHDSVICNGVFYCITCRTDMVNRKVIHGLITYQLSSDVLKVMGMPFSLSPVRLMNCNNKLVMVGGIDKSGRFAGISIWELDTEWQEVAKMPHKYVTEFVEFYDIFLSSGSGDLIYIHPFGSPHLLLLYDMSQRSWRQAQKYPMLEKPGVSHFTGFCFEPRLEACA